MIAQATQQSGFGGQKMCVFSELFCPPCVKGQDTKLIIFGNKVFQKYSYQSVVFAHCYFTSNIFLIADGLNHSLGIKVLQLVETYKTDTP